MTRLIYLEYCLSPRDNSFKLAQHMFLVNRSLTLFQLFTLIVVCSLLWVYTLVAYIANNIPRSDYSWGRLIWVHNACFHVKTSLKCICIYAVGIKSRWHFLDKISAGYLKAYKMPCISITFLTQCDLMFPGLPINESQLYEMFIT